MRYRIVIGIMACDTKEFYREQIFKLEKTWRQTADKFNNVKVLYFLGEEKTDIKGKDYVNLPGVGNDYMSASYKQNLGLKHVHEKYDYDFVMIIGTDVYINIPKLLLFLEAYDRDARLYIGSHGDVRNFRNRSLYFHSGGPGFVLSYGTMIKLYPLLQNLTGEWARLCHENDRSDWVPACDLGIAYFLQSPEVDVTVVRPEGCPFRHCNYKGHPCCGNNVDLTKLIACHNMSLTDFDDFTRILEENKFFIEPSL